VKYSQLLAGSDINRLATASDLGSLIEGLKQTAYGPEVEQLRERVPESAAVIGALRRRQAIEAQSCIQAAPGAARRVLIQLHRRHEVNNLKALLRAIAAGKSLDTAESENGAVKVLLFPLGASTVLRPEQMLEAGSVPAAVELLRGTHYHEVLVFALRRYSAEESLFPLEVALDLAYWRRLWQEARKLAGEDQTQALKVIGSLVDATNILWAIRYRSYQRLSEEELINYTLPFGQRVRDADIRAIAAGADIGSVLGRLYPEVGDLAGFLDQRHEGLPRLEIELKRVVARRCMAAFLGNPFHIGLPLAYLILHDLEIQDLIVLLEAKSTYMATEEFHPYLLGRAGVPV
jgi:vacuolar-type H+-ATPase subunit C/Vma6